MDTLFKEQIGPSYQSTELTSIYSDGEIRYPHSIPPGYARGSHTDKRICYHDLIVWKQMIKYSKEMERNNNRMDILLVHWKHKERLVLYCKRSIGFSAS